jgi:5-dehydro-4-deoxyglucarate dehydratase
MQFTTFKDQLRGIWAFPVTPFDDQLAVDTDALQATLSYLIEARPAGLVAAGGSGEHFSLDLDEYRSIVQSVVHAAKGAIPVIAGVGGGYGVGTEQARIARAAGADGLMALPPSYPRPVDDGLVAYYASLAKASGLPLVLYTRDWAAYGPDLVARLAELPAVVGLKEGQGDLRALARLRARLGDRLAWLGGVGDDLAIGYAAAGAAGFTSSIFNFAPSIVHELWQAATSGDLAHARALSERWIVPVYVMRARRAGYEVSVTKAAMRLVGLPGGRVRPPLVEILPSEVDELEQLLVGLPRACAAVA